MIEAPRPVGAAWAVILGLLDETRSRLCGLSRHGRGRCGRGGGRHPRAAAQDDGARPGKLTREAREARKEARKEGRPEARPGDALLPQLNPREWDTNHNDIIEDSELADAMPKILGAARETSAALLRAFDANGNGKLDPEERDKIMEMALLFRAAGQLQQVDPNNDGVAHPNAGSCGS